MHNLSLFDRRGRSRPQEKSFWILAISFPLMFAAIFDGLFVQSSYQRRCRKAQTSRFSIAITDESKMVKPQLIAASKATEINPSDKQNAIDRVKTASLMRTSTLSKELHQSIEADGKDVGIFDNGRYGSLG